MMMITPNLIALLTSLVRLNPVRLDSRDCANKISLVGPGPCTHALVYLLVHLGRRGWPGAIGPLDSWLLLVTPCPLEWCWYWPLAAN